MNYNILTVIILAIVGSIVLVAVAKNFRHLFQVPEGHAGFLCIENGKAGSREHKPEDGAS